MNLDFLQLSNQQISYYYSANPVFSIVLLHGNSSSGSTFEKQLNSKLGGKFGLIALDLPGHGNSDLAPKRTQYSLTGYAQLVAEVLQTLEINNAFLVGGSLGGHIALQTSVLSNRVKGIMIYGAPPLKLPLEAETAFLAHEAIRYIFTPDLSEKNARHFAASLFSINTEKNTAPFVKDILHTYNNARLELGKSINAGQYKNEIEIVANLNIPLAVLHGKDDQLVNGAYYSTIKMPTLWKNKIQTITKAGHAIHWEQPELFNEILMAFITDCNSVA